MRGVHVIDDSGLGVEVVVPGVLSPTQFLGCGEAGEYEEVKGSDRSGCIGNVLAVLEFNVIAVLVWPSLRFEWAAGLKNGAQKSVTANMTDAPWKANLRLCTSSISPFTTSTPLEAKA
jgi:hypothetical protein